MPRYATSQDRELWGIDWWERFGRPLSDCGIKMKKKPNTYTLHVPKTSQDQRSSSILVIGELSVTYAWLTDKWRRWHLLALTRTIASVGRSWRHLTCARPLHRRHPNTQSQSNDWFNQSVNQWEHASNPPRFSSHTRRHYSLRTIRVFF